MVRYISGWNKPAFLTVWQSPEGETDPKITVHTATRCLALSDLYPSLSHAHTHTNRHTCTNAAVRRGAEREKRLCLAGQLYGQAEISGCFPSSKLRVSVVTDRQSDSQTLSLSLTHTHIHTHAHTNAHWWTQTRADKAERQKDTFFKGTIKEKDPNSQTDALLKHSHWWLLINSNTL